MKLAPQEMEALVAKARNAQLSCAEKLAAMPIVELCRIYNGAGPAWLKESARKKLTNWLREFAPAFVGHDVAYDESDGKLDSFERANKYLYDDCVKLANHNHPWWSWRRYVGRAKALAVYEAVELLGYVQWLACYNRRKDLGRVA